jgi:hypothetical protein
VIRPVPMWVSIVGKYRKDHANAIIVMGGILLQAAWSLGIWRVRGVVVGVRKECM